MGPAPQVTALKGCASELAARGTRSRASVPSSRPGPPRPGEQPRARRHVQSPRNDQHDQTTSPETRGTGQCSVQSSSEAREGPSPPLWTRQDPSGAFGFSFCAVLPSSQEGPGLRHRAGTPAHRHHGTGPTVSQAHPRPGDPAQDDGGHCPVLGPHSSAPHSLGRTGPQTPLHPILHDGLGWLC